MSAQHTEQQNSFSPVFWEAIFPHENSRKSPYRKSTGKWEEMRLKCHLIVSLAANGFFCILVFQFLVLRFLAFWFSRG